MAEIEKSIKNNLKKLNEKLKLLFSSIIIIIY